MAQLWATFQTYDDENKSDAFSVDVKNKFSGPFRNALIALGKAFFYKDLFVATDRTETFISRFSLPPYMYLDYRNTQREREREKIMI